MIPILQRQNTTMAHATHQHIFLLYYVITTVLLLYVSKTTTHQCALTRIQNRPMFFFLSILLWLWKWVKVTDKNVVWMSTAQWNSFLCSYKNSAYTASKKMPTCNILCNNHTKSEFDRIRFFWRKHNSTQYLFCNATVICTGSHLHTHMIWKCSKDQWRL